MIANRGEARERRRSGHPVRNVERMEGIEQASRSSWTLLGRPALGVLGMAHPHAHHMDIPVSAEPGMAAVERITNVGREINFDLP